MTAALARLDGRPALIAALMAGLLAVVVPLTAAVAPASVRGPAMLAVASAVLLLGYLRWPKPALLVFALYMLMNDTFARWLGPSLDQVDEVVVGGLVIVAGWRLKPWRRPELFEPVRDGAVVALLAIALVSSIVNAVPASLWLIGLVLMAKIIAFLYIVIWHDFTVDDVRQFAPIVLAVAAVLLTLGMVELIDGPGFRRFFMLSEFTTPRGQLPSIRSIFWHPVVFTWFMGFVSLFLFAFYVVFRRWWMLIAAVVFGLGAVLGARRRTIAGVALGLGVGLLNQLRFVRAKSSMARSWLPIAAGVVIITILFLPGLIGLYQLTIQEAGPLDPDRDPGADQQARTLMYTTSARIAADYFPLGAGLGRFGSAGSRLDYSPLYEQYGLDDIYGLEPANMQFMMDTFWPRILGEAGVFGLVAYLAFIGAIGVALWRITGRATTADPYLRAFTLGTLMIFSEALVETLASSMFDSPPRIYLVFGAIGMCYALRRRYLSEPPPT